MEIVPQKKGVQRDINLQTAAEKEGGTRACHLLNVMIHGYKITK